MTEQQKKELIEGFGFVDFDNNEKAETPSPDNWKPMQDWEFFEGSLKVHRIVQELKKQRLELTKEESNKFLQQLTNINHK